MKKVGAVEEISGVDADNRKPILGETVIRVKIICSKAQEESDPLANQLWKRVCSNPRLYLIHSAPLMIIRAYVNEVRLIIAEVRTDDSRGPAKGWKLAARVSSVPKKHILICCAFSFE
jgi:hypothetical protein